MCLCVSERLHYI
uniref:Uncharacterized protein n=1 Tax=Anguilla anguilla TaxID=7936 RepID=A0A0E9VP90_ANGAN